MTRKNKNRKSIPKSKKSNKSQKKVLKFSWHWIALLLLIIAVVLINSDFVFKNKKKQEPKSSFNPKFKVEGELIFYKDQTGKKLKTIDIEIADNDYERMLGLMYRKSMPDSVGMLFIMKNEEPQSFWMRNTYISLDIIYLDSNLEVVTIRKHTQVFSDEQIPSIKKAKFVIEVIAGFTDKNNIEVGDFVKYKKSTL